MQPAAGATEPDSAFELTFSLQFAVSCALSATAARLVSQHTSRFLAMDGGRCATHVSGQQMRLCGCSDCIMFLATARVRMRSLGTNLCEPQTWGWKQQLQLPLSSSVPHSECLVEQAVQKNVITMGSKLAASEQHAIPTDITWNTFPHTS